MAPLPTDSALAAVLRSMREERSLTQEDLAHASGLTVAALARIERGQANPRWTTVLQIASGLGVTLGELGAAVERAAR